uniref:Putative ixodes 10 kDa peptide protein n=1 Tax=Ixodes ricinus TaxID=34613 RepID=A0A0K8RK02_IXORI
MLPISKMQLVAFAVVLILPALQSGFFLSGTVVHDDCMDLLTECGERECLLRGGGKFKDYNPKFCMLECSGNIWPKVPDGVCKGNVEECDSSTRESLRNWLYALQTNKKRSLEKLVPYSFLK